MCRNATEAECCRERPPCRSEGQTSDDIGTPRRAFPTGLRDDTMTSVPLSADKSPVLRTLSPALRGLERGLRNYLDGVHRLPLQTMTRASLEGLSNDLGRQATSLDVDR